jgi:YhcH/YjgK/YiaL family protein
MGKGGMNKLITVIEMEFKKMIIPCHTTRHSLFLRALAKPSFLGVLLLFIVLQASLSPAEAQTGYYTREYTDRPLMKSARQWLKSGVWRHDFHKADPHPSVNATEFYQQYEKNAQQWRALFRWLADTDLLAISAGKHPIPGTQLVASVEDSKNGPLSQRNSESHYHHIDFQYVVRGTERFGIIDHETSTQKDEYKPDVIHYNYEVERTKFYDSTPDKFFIFFPDDWHIAKVENDTNDQNIRVIVIKVDYID